MNPPSLADSLSQDVRQSGERLCPGNPRFLAQFFYFRLGSHPDDVIHVGLDLDELEVTPAESKATYGEIKAYVWEKFGLKVSSLYISQIKRKCGLDVGENYNLPKSEDAKQPQCPPEKEKAIVEALKHFQMIEEAQWTD